METVNKEPKSYVYSFDAEKQPEEIFELLLDVNRWWSGLYNETITGKSAEINDEFSFLAGNSTHFTKQKLIELVPNRKIVWLVIESNLTFLSDPKEWIGTKIQFDLTQKAGKTTVTFTHVGLIPRIECYNMCSMAWTEYLENLEQLLNKNNKVKN